MSVRNSAAAGIVRADFDRDSVSRQNSDVKLTHSSADGGEDDEAVVAFDAKHRVRQRLLHDAVEFELVALRFFSFSPFAHTVSVLVR